MTHTGDFAALSMGDSAYANWGVRRRVSEGIDLVCY